MIMRKISFILFVVCLVLAIVSGKILEKQEQKYPGDAISGRVVNDKYFFSSEGEFIEVSKSVYYTNITLWVAMLIFSLVAGISGVIVVFINLIKPALKRLKL